MNKKIFVFDMDGTILNEKGKLPLETIVSLKRVREAGHKTIIATGRPYLDILRGLNHEHSNLFDYLIANNGAYFVEVETNQFFYNTEVPKEFVKKLIELGIEHNSFLAIHFEKEAVRTYLGENLDELLNSPTFAEFTKFPLFDLSSILERVEKEKIMQASLRHDANTTKILKDKFGVYRDSIDIHIANDVYLDVNPLGVSKLSGIKNVLEIIGDSLENVVAFGDSGNDIDMLKGAKIGIAMGNSNESAIEAADLVIGDNNSDAIAKKIIEFL